MRTVINYRSMRSYQLRFVLGLRCTFIYHHTLSLQIVVILLILCICAGSLKHFLGAHVQKTYCKINVVPVLGRSAKDLASLYTYAQSRQSLHAACQLPTINTLNARVCETVLVFGVPVQKVREPQRLLKCLFSFESVAHEQ